MSDATCEGCGRPFTVDELDRGYTHVHNKTDLTELDSLRAQLTKVEKGRDEALHASAMPGYKCSDCTIDKEPCVDCYAAWWIARHHDTHVVGGIVDGKRFAEEQCGRVQAALDAAALREAALREALEYVVHGPAAPESIKATARNAISAPPSPTTAFLEAARAYFADEDFADLKADGSSGDKLFDAALAAWRKEKESVALLGRSAMVTK